MNFEDMDRALQDIGRGVINSTPETEWRKTVSGRIYTCLEEIAKKLGEPLQIENKGGG